MLLLPSGSPAFFSPPAPIPVIRRKVQEAEGLWTGLSPSERVQHCSQILTGFCTCPPLSASAPAPYPAFRGYIRPSVTSHPGQKRLGVGSFQPTTARCLPPPPLPSYSTPPPPVPKSPLTPHPYNSDLDANGYQTRPRAVAAVGWGDTQASLFELPD